MTPLFAYLIACAFTAVLLVGAWLTEETEPGRRASDALVEWIVGSRR